MLSAREARKQKAQIVCDLLADVYGVPLRRPHLAPVDQLINTILSQQTNEANRQQAFEALKARFADWEAVIDADLDAVRQAIRPAGLANQKAPRIQNALRYIMRERGQLSIDFLAEWPVEKAKRWLTEIKGVGPKTASIVLLFTFGLPAFPVDTHVHRITRRLGLIGTKVTADKAHKILEDMIAPDQYYAFHINLIRHGREVCHARDPHCQICALQEQCDYYQ